MIKIKQYAIIFVLILTTFIFVKNYELKLSENDFFKLSTSENLEKVFYSSQIQEELYRIFNVQLLIEHLTLKREDFDFLNLTNTFNLSVIFSPPKFSYVSNSNFEPNEPKFYYDFNPLSSLTIEFNELWNNKEDLPRYEKPGVEFAGLYEGLNGGSNAFIYFFDSLMKLSVGEKLGEDIILEIFEDGILIFTQQNEFQALF